MDRFTAFLDSNVLYPAEYLDTLERQGLTQTVAELRGYASVL